jgi:hypothetical protein
MLDVQEWDNGCGFTIKISAEDADDIYEKLEQNRNEGAIIQGSNYDIQVERQID